MVQCVAACCSRGVGLPCTHAGRHLLQCVRQLQCVAVRCSALQCVAAYCSALQCVVVCCSVLQCAAVRGSALQHVAVRCNVLQFVIVCCNVLQCVAVCCSVLQCVAAIMACHTPAGEGHIGYRVEFYGLGFRVLRFRGSKVQGVFGQGVEGLLFNKHPHSHACHASLTYVPCLIDICAMPHSHACHASFTAGMSHMSMRHGTYVNEAWHICQ